MLLVDQWLDLLIQSFPDRAQDGAAFGCESRKWQANRDAARCVKVHANRPRRAGDPEVDVPVCLATGLLHERATKAKWVFHERINR